MSQVDESPCLNQACRVRAKEIFDDRFRRLHARVDRMFVILMACQWAFTVSCTLWLSPFTWDGPERHVHPHVWSALILGGLLTLGPAWLGLRYPGRWFTRHTIALCQVGFSSLLIHVMGGRIETHFHVFGSLAFLAAYRDWTVLVPATLFVALDHVVRGVFWPESVFGLATSSSWRWLEHAGWVLFEDLWLVICCRQGVQEARAISESSAALEASQRAAEAANEAKSLFLANMSHEIRTPLNGILGFTDFLRTSDHRLSPSERREQLETIHRSGEHLLTLINDLLDLSKIEAGEMRYERVRFSPHQVIADVLSIMRVRAAERGLQLEARWLGRVPETIQSDPARFRQILLNLVGNALKFTERGEVVILSRLDATRDLLQVEVVDTGIGIPADKLESIFTRFSQADASVTRKFGGTGLGLSICRHVAEALGGTISAASTVGQGSTFTVTVATGSLAEVTMLVKPPTEALRPEKSQRTESLRLEGLKVLVVDDSITNRKLFNVLLSRSGAKVELVENGQEAVDRVRQGGLDVVLMDMQMPVLDGYSATRELRAAGVTVPILALTAHAMSGEAEKCKAAGCNEYLTKPVSEAELLQAIRHLVPVSAEMTVTQSQAAAPGESAVQARQAAAVKPPRRLSVDVSNDPVLREIFDEFKRQLPDRLMEFRTAREGQDWATIISSAHVLKGSAGMFGFPEIGTTAAEMEQAAKASDPTRIERLLDELEELVETAAKV